MPNMLDLVRYGLIKSVRLPDGARITAKRVVVDTSTPIHWTITTTDQKDMPIDIGLPTFEDTQGKILKEYLTRELSELSEKAGFTDWKRLPVDAVPGFELIDGKEMERGFPKDQDPDSTDYPLE